MWQKPFRRGRERPFGLSHSYFTAFLSSAPAENFGTAEAAIARAKGV